MSPDAHPSIPPENASSSLDARPSKARIPRQLFWIAGSVLMWFLLTEAATEGWYRWKESQAAITEPWQIQWPTTDDAASRGFLHFQPRELTSVEQELLQYESANTGSWRDANGNAWTGFLLKWRPDKRLNQSDIDHNPALCFPAAGIKIGKKLPDFIVDDFQNRVSAWEFEAGGRAGFVFLTTRWQRDFEPWDYKRNYWQRKIGAFWKALSGNRGNPVETLELVVVGPINDTAARQDLQRQIQMLQSRR